MENGKWEQILQNEEFACQNFLFSILYSRVPVDSQLESTGTSRPSAGSQYPDQDSHKYEDSQPIHDPTTFDRVAKSPGGTFCST